MFIDATYEGDLMAAAGCSYHVGREANSVYRRNVNASNWTASAPPLLPCLPVSPYVVPGTPRAGCSRTFNRAAREERRGRPPRLAVLLSHLPDAESGEPRALPEAENYNPMNYELLLRELLTGRKDFFEKFDMIPNLKTDTNNHGAFSSGLHRHELRVSRVASYAERREILKAHENYQKGVLLLRRERSACPAAIREEMAQLGAGGRRIHGQRPLAAPNLCA